MNAKYLILGVAFDWGIRKGLDVFLWLAENLPKEYKIVLVGTNDTIDKQLTDSIVSIHRTNNQEELAAIYSAADVFVNPTREDNFPTTNIEALACGTPVITFNTGGSAEMLSSQCGAAVECEDFENLKKEIIRICVEKPYNRDDCRMQAKRYDMSRCFEQYLELYG